uniref:Secreted protein n=1 Tax=Aegilops tauschii subsp. strangulata TaxID=200361 RepID=A0A453HCJ2_AEGTS
MLPPSLAFFLACTRWSCSASSTPTSRPRHLCVFLHHSIAVLLSFQVCAENPRCGDLNNVPSLPAVAYMLLRNKFFLTTSTLTAAEESRDKTTTKLLIRLQVRWLMPPHPPTARWRRRRSRRGRPGWCLCLYGDSVDLFFAERMKLHVPNR